MLRLAAAALALAAAAVAVFILLREEPERDAGVEPGGGVECTQRVEVGADVEAAIGAAGPGDVVCLAAGEHRGDVTVRAGGSRAEPLVVRSERDGAATLRGRLVVSEEATDLVFAGLRLDGENGDDAPSPTVLGDRVVFRDNDVTNGRTAICFVLGAVEADSTAEDVVLERNRIHDCGRRPPTNKDHGVYVERARNAVIADNVIYDNADRGVQLYPDAQGTVVERNVIDGNGQGVLFGGEGDLASSGSVVRDNVISNSRLRHNVESWYPGRVGSDNVAAGNCLWSARLGNVGEERGFTARDNVVADPLFVDRAAKDFRLREDSPCAGKGPATG